MVRSTIESGHSPSSDVGSAGSVETYRSTRPNGRAAAMAAPVPTATVHRTASAKAPGCAPKDRFVSSVGGAEYLTLAPMLSGLVIVALAGGH